MGKTQSQVPLLSELRDQARDKPGIISNEFQFRFGTPARFVLDTPITPVAEVVVINPVDVADWTASATR